MDQITISMGKDGAFDLADDDVTWRLRHIDSFAPRPWVLAAFDPSQPLTSSDIDGNLGGAIMAGKDQARASFAMYDSYESLDEALVGLVHAARGEPPSTSGKDSEVVVKVDDFKTVPHFRVKLPCGSSFLRPGKVPAEQVIYGFGWVQIRRLRGFMMRSIPKKACQIQVRDEFRKAMTMPGARLGEIAKVDEVDGYVNWCADVLLDFDGFVRIDEVMDVAAAAFVTAGPEMLNYFDFVPYARVAACAAQVINFPAKGQRTAA